MVNYHDPVVIQKDLLVWLEFWHVVAGLYFWELVTTLDYEWSVIRGHRPYRWTIWIYIVTRISTLVAVILILLNLDAPPDIFNCEVIVIFQLFFGYLSNLAASLLIVLRVRAIWNKNKVITAIAAVAWVTNIIFETQSTIRIRTIQIPGSCLVPNLHIFKLNILVTLTTDVILLLTMFIGLLRRGFHERGTFELGRLMWKQGVIWLLVATIAELLPAVFLCLDLNYAFNEMFLFPAMITLSIAATRIYRSLVDHTFSGSTKQLDSEGSDRVVWKANRGPITVSRMEVAISRTSDQDQTPQTWQTSQNGSLARIEG